MASDKLISVKDAYAQAEAMFHGDPVLRLAVRAVLDCTPEATPQEPGRWEPHPNHPGFDRCSVCHNCIIASDWADGEKWNFCPQCGHPMERGVEHGKT